MCQALCSGLCSPRSLEAWRFAGSCEQCSPATHADTIQLSVSGLALLFCLGLWENFDHLKFVKIKFKNCICVCVCMSRHTHMEVREQLEGVSSPSPLHASRGSNSGLGSKHRHHLSHLTNPQMFLWHMGPMGLAIMVAEIVLFCGMGLTLHSHFAYTRD